MKQKQKERWARLRIKGMRYFIIRGIVISALCAVAGHLIFWLLMLIWRGESTPHFVKEPGSAIAMIMGFAFAGYLESNREWSRNEREYLAAVEGESNDDSVA